jgi:leucyl/phenylalanyl-tRNA--protein transferase
MTGRGPYWLDPQDSSYSFPPTRLALRDPNGLLAVGGDLSPGRLLAAYRRGIFPWYSDDQPILWWSPHPRVILRPEELKVSRSLAKTLRNKPFEVTFDRAFERVMRACAEPRADGLGTWITEEMVAAYVELHRLGHAHSAECWLEGELVGGLYGLAIGRVFFGESMFARRTDASKVAFAHLVRHLRAWGFGLIDCQVGTEHLLSLGAHGIPRADFEALLDRWCDLPGRPAPWKWELPWEPAP